MASFTVQRTFMARQETVVREWHHVDVDGKTLGRVATRIAEILMGKHRPTYTPHVDTGDYVVVTNAEKVRLTGNKVEQKLYHYHTGYIGGLRTHNLQWMLDNKPELVIQLAVRRMLPKSKLGKQMLKKLKVHRGAEHPHGAQDPKPLEIDA